LSFGKNTGQIEGKSIGNSAGDDWNRKQKNWGNPETSKTGSDVFQRKVYEESIMVWNGGLNAKEGGK